MVSTSLMVDTIPVPSRRNILCAVNCALTENLSAVNSSGGYRLTEAGMELLRSAQCIEEAVVAFQRKLAAGDRSLSGNSPDDDDQYGCLSFAEPAAHRPVPRALS